MAPAHRGQCKQANSRCPLATTRWTWRRNGASCTWPSWSGRSSSGASLRGGWLRAVGGALWWRGSHPRVSHYCPERKSPPRLGNPHPGRARRQWAAGWRRGQKQEGARVLRPGAWQAVPSQRVPWVLGRRLECLQRIVSKLQMEAGLCEEQLNQADALLQSVRGRGRGGTGQRQQGGGVGRGGSLKLPLLAGGSQLLPPGAQPALTAGFEQSRAGLWAPGRTLERPARGLAAWTGVGRMRPRDLGGGQGLASRPQGAMAGILCILKTCGAGWGEEGKGRGRGLSRSPPCRISGCWQRARQHSGRVMWSGTWTRRTA